MWSKVSPLRNNWYDFAVKLVGTRDADLIKFTHCEGGYNLALQRTINIWYKSTTDHSWQMIVDALEQIDDTDVTIFIIKSIKKECLIPVCIHCN